MIFNFDTVLPGLELTSKVVHALKFKISGASPGV